jgi:hypothetical protein
VRLTQQLIAEFIGTLALIFIGAGAVVVLAPQGGPAALVGIALAHGLVLAIFVSWRVPRRARHSLRGRSRRTSGSRRTWALQR